MSGFLRSVSQPFTRVLARRETLAPLAMLLVLVAGCHENPPPPKVVAPLYNGPLLNVQDVVIGLDTRYSPIRTLWAKHEFTVVVLNSRGQEKKLEGDGVLLMRKPPRGSPAGTPTDLRLIGNSIYVEGNAFDLGNNRDRSWLALGGVGGEKDSFYWMPQGATVAEDIRDVPVRPDVLTEVLGLGDWVTDLGRYPSPVLTYDSGRDAYRLILIEPAANGSHLAARREVIVDRVTLLIKQITFFAPDGRPAVIADLTAQRQVPGVANAYVPTDIALTLPLSKANMRFTLQEIAVTKKGVPADASFMFPAHRLTPEVNVRRLDQPAQQR